MGKAISHARGIEGISEEFLAEKSGSVRFDRRSGRWYIYEPPVWVATDWGRRLKCDNERYLARDYLDRWCAANQPELTPSIGQVDALIGNIRMRSGEFPPPKPGLIAFENGVLDIADIPAGVRRHSPDDCLTRCLPYPWTDDLGDCPAYRSLVGRLIGEGVDELREEVCLLSHLGLAMVGDTKQHRSLLFLGPPRSGKTTLLRLANLLLGAPADQTASNLLFDQGREGSIQRHACRDWPIVCLDEFPAEAIADGSVYKAMVAHGGVESRMLYAGSRNEQWRPKLILCSNEVPRFRDDTGAIRRRLIIVKCRRPDDGPVDHGYIDRLRGELSSIARLCVAHVARVDEEALYPISDRSKALYDETLVEGDPLHAFADDALVISRGEETALSDIYDAYTRWARLTGHRQMSNRELARRMLQHPEWGVERARLTSGTVLRGVALRDSPVRVDAHGRVFLRGGAG